MTGRPCATTERDRCTYVEHEPRSCAGWQAWDVLTRCSRQLRIVGSNIVGVDLAAAMALGAALGYDQAILAELLPAAEAGMIAALTRSQDEAG